MYRVMDMDGRELGSGFDSFKAAVDFGDKHIAQDKSFRVKGDRGGSEEVNPDFRVMLPRLDAIAKLTLRDFMPC